MITTIIGDGIGSETEGSPMVLVSLRPRSYSDTIGQVIGELRPDLRVYVVEAVALAEEVRRLEPDLVLCSQPRVVDGDDASGTSWVEYYPYAEPPEDEIRVDGRSSDERAVELSDLLALIDRALARV